MLLELLSVALSITITVTTSQGPSTLTTDFVKFL